MSSQTTLINCPPLPHLGLILYGSIPPFSGQWVEICKVRTVCGERGRKVPYKPLLQWPATHSPHHLPSLPVLLEAVFGNNTVTKGFPAGSESKQSVCSARDRRCRFHPWFGKIPWRKIRQPTPVFLPEKSHGQRHLAGCSPKGHKELDATEQLSMHAQSQRSLQKVP